jgi:catechol 2,3-dioxygenase-like lactoylglutathione lyase family enzyme
MRDPQLRFDHFAIPVTDAPKARHFYEEVLGLTLVDAMSGDDWGGKPWLMMIFRAADERQVALCALRGARRVAKSDGLPADIRHFAFSARSEAEYSAWKKRLTSHSVGFSEEDHGDQRSIYFCDPDGNMLEITTPPSTSAERTNETARAVIERWLHGQT